MRTRVKKPTQEEIDRIVTADSETDSAWDKPIRVHRRKNSAVPIPAELAARAAFFARLHREASIEDWLKRIILERMDLEEAAFAELKREFAAK